MGQAILFPIDCTDLDQEFIQLADEWTLKMGGTLHFLRVTSPSAVSTEAEMNKEQEDQLSVLKELVQDFEMKSPHEVHHCFGSPAVSIVKQAKDLGAGLILMEAHTKGLLERLLLGSNTDYVLRHAPCPLYVQKRTFSSLENKAIIPIDYTRINKPVIESTDFWAQHTGTELIFVHVFKPLYLPHLQQDDDWGDSEEEVNQSIAEAENKLRDYVATLNIQSKYQTHLLTGETPHLVIQEFQQQINARLISMAAHSHSTLDRLLMGSNTDYLLRNTECSMYIHREEESA